jgi:hypothetical protein
VAGGGILVLRSQHACRMGSEYQDEQQPDRG